MATCDLELDLAEKRAMNKANYGTSYNLIVIRARCYELRRLLGRAVELARLRVDIWALSDGP